MVPLEIQDLGLQPYADVWSLQQRYVDERARGLSGDRLLLLEHEPVYTLGRRTPPEQIPPPGPVPVVKVERGGEISFHEPGQIVGYPICLLSGPRRDVRAFLHGLEQVLIDCLAELGFKGERDARNTGVWVEGLKVASIGIAVRRWVTWHGFALNVNNDLALARAIRPCGFEPEIMTSLARLQGAPPGFKPGSSPGRARARSGPGPGQGLDIAALKLDLGRRFAAWWAAEPVADTVLVHG